MPATVIRPQNDAAIRRLVGERMAGHSLPADFYTSDEIFNLDLDAIFGRQWIFVASEAEIREPGDYVTIEFGKTSLIVIRDDDEQVQVLHNVCRHRGARILQPGAGSVGNLVCGYHQWTYRPDGELIWAASAAEEFDKTCYNLRKIPFRNIAGLIYVNLSDEPNDDIDAVARVVEPYFDQHQLPRAKVAAQIDLIEEGNWKLTLENNRECYHCDMHPELGCTYFITWGYPEDKIPPHLQEVHERYLAAEAELEHKCTERGLAFRGVEELDTRAFGFRVQREALDGEGESYSMTGAKLVKKLLGDFDDAKLGRLSMHTQPNFWCHFMADHAMTFAVLPIAPGKTLVRTTWLVHEDAVEGVDYDVDELTYVWRETNNQDAGFVALAQKGVTDPAYVPGPYVPSEYQVDAFCNWYLDRVNEFINAGEGRDDA
ncbi:MULTISPECIES: aromatic ring-hydroxylating dioxygenase subunit alpha [Rhodococcus]|uniref:Aromatic ring-hydroxylating dioxygenase subunit alpha n=1 Tax=Rhodococcus oxybenzonivorans TaxID=1990687 RepID=A0AAE5A6R4_9NOCA|nr:MULTISPECIES: aromatic ring-hydroxylating dioxygenase subunit alpha [Rhodococcus]MDV7240574.1 aromatic ring-hydroxylating dioxygenase subunit alpha [Rhodococcus oxybenzonivorans]MDV7265731.1 aromatic ring-hydroxylating dioxygenase subunit alpha [Rhodococcus oxybenzonivorans]MDV7272847.1 aromatic ring-hydroxylating dioxygenase subunit alpha [Rhodococcus oxybenzonivorans]MDV7333414.1 aromatic ring-hydroxylating dioxygenase subunit alpha [Rhodococcus oxybenzonivorans]MDV7342581.1 aromatic ring